MIIPPIGLGTWPMREECAEVVSRAIDIGYRHIDTAQHYENEKDVGRGIALSGISRSEFFLVTKIRKQSFEADQNDPVKSVEESLDRLGTSYVDALLIHDFFDVPAKDMMDVLLECRARGYARYIGVSNFTPAEMQEAQRYADIDVRQDKFYPFMVPPAKDMAFIAFSPIKHVCGGGGQRLIELSEKYGKTPAQIALRWIVQQGISAIPKSAHSERLKENISIFDFELSDEEMFPDTVL